MTADSGFFFAHKTRFVVLLLSTICLTVMMSNSLSLSMTVICMDDLAVNDSDHWLYSSNQRNALFSAVAVGSILGTIPLMSLIRYFGTRKTITFYGLASGIATFLLPWAAESSFVFILIIRVIQGLSLGVLFSATGTIATTWSSVAATGTYIAFLSAHVQMAPIFTMPLAGFLCETGNWRILYYGQGIVTICLFVLFFFFYQNCPSKHRNVSAKELSTISYNKPKERPGKQAVPYIAVIFTPSILGVFLSCLGMCFGFLILLYYGPIYMNRALGVDVRSTGLITSLPYILAVGVKFIAGPLYDKSSFLSDRCRIIIFAVVSQGIMAVCYFLLSMASSALLAHICYTTAIVFSGLNIVGTIKCAQLVAQQYVPFVMAVISMISNLVTLGVPAIVSIICPDETIEQWSNLFLYLSITLVVCNMPFIYLADSQPAAWTKPDWSKRVQDINQAA